MTDRPSSHDHFYQRLDVDPEASRDEIVHAYRRLAHGAHPDTQPGDPDAARRFREITEAYEVLTDPSRRASYDRTRAGLPIRVVVRPAESRSPGLTWPRHDVTNAGPTVYLGTARNQIGEVPLRAGPVRVEQPSPTAPVREGNADETLMEWVTRVLDAWGRP